MAEKLKLSNNQINKILVAQTTYTIPAGPIEAVNHAKATVEVQVPAGSAAALRTAPVVSEGDPTGQRAIAKEQVPSGMQF